MNYPKKKTRVHLIYNTYKNKSIKYSVINITKEAKDLYTEKCRTLMKEMEDNK